jgi:pyruvate dehydrogenase E2 component (dihydrolipoamide acetyltransferase)
MSKLIEVKVPDIGDFNMVPVIEISVAVGDTVAAGDTVIVLESDKATLDVPTEIAGRVAEIRLSKGDLVSADSVMMMLEPTGAETQPLAKKPDQPVNPSPAPAAVPLAQPAPIAVVATETAPGSAGKASHASPSVRKFARELGVTLADITGTGAKGRITRDDIQALVKALLTGPKPAAATGGVGLDLPPWPSVDFAKFGEVERVPLSRIARISGPSLTRNAIMIPHVTNFEETDVTDLENFRKAVNATDKSGTKLTMLAFVVKAAVVCLRAYPKFNSSLECDALVVKKYFNIGVAADTPDGLVVPVVKDADKKGLMEIAAEMADLAEAARAGKLKATDMQGATFTVSSLGGIGNTNFTPIINAPEVAILGLTRASMKPIWDGTAFQPRLIQPMSLSWDHRVVDGVAAAKFLVLMKDILSDFRRICL